VVFIESLLGAVELYCRYYSTTVRLLALALHKLLSTEAITFAFKFRDCVALALRNNCTAKRNGRTSFGRTNGYIRHREDRL